MRTLPPANTASAGSRPCSGERASPRAVASSFSRRAAHARCDRGARVGRAPRPAGPQLAGKLGAPELDPHPLGRQPEPVGRDLGQDRVGARCRCRSCPTGRRRCRPPPAAPAPLSAPGNACGSRPPCRSRPATDRRARSPGAAGRRSQPNRRAPSRRHSTRLPVAEGHVRVSGSTVGSFRIRSSTGSIPSACGQLVHRRLDREQARRLARRADVLAARQVERRQPVAASAGGARRRGCASWRRSARRTPRRGWCAW